MATIEYSELKECGNQRGYRVSLDGNAVACIRQQWNLERRRWPRRWYVESFRAGRADFIAKDLADAKERLAASFDG